VGHDGGQALQAICGSTHREILRLDLLSNLGEMTGVILNQQNFRGTIHHIFNNDT
jgi:hypothetical protein